MSGTYVSVESGEIRVHPSFADMLVVQRLGGRFLGASRKWAWPATHANAVLLSKRLRHPLTTPEFDALLVRPAPEDALPAAPPEPRPDFQPMKPPAEPEVPVPQGMITRPWRHQKAAFKFCLDHFAAGFRGILLAMGMGCVEGDAELIINRRGCSRRMTLREFHRKFHGGESNGRRWRDLPTRSRSMIDGEFRLNEVLDVIAQGVRPVVRVTLASGKSLRVTTDHEFARPDGTWTEAVHLAAGDTVLTNGAPACKCCGGTHRVTTYRYAKHVGICRSCIGSFRRVKGKVIDKDGYVRLYGMKSHPRANKAGQVYEHIVVMERFLGRPITAAEHVHHKNHVRHDNRPENLEVLPATEHYRHHGVHGGYVHLDGEAVHFIPKPDTVVSIKPDGETDVYDVRMTGPGHNFVANGIVVHNCGKSLVACMLVLHLMARRVLIACPLRVAPVWVTQFERHVGVPVVIVALDEGIGSVASKQKEAAEKMKLAQALGRPCIVVVNYDSVWRDPFAPWAEKVPWDLVIADECVASDTVIATPAGPAPIRLLKRGDLVLGVDDEGRVVPARVSATFRHHTRRPLVQIDSLLATHDHPVWVEGRGYVPAREVKTGDRVLVYEDNHDHLRMVRSVFHEDVVGRHERLRGRGAGHLVFNLETSTGNYFASGILVHNCHRLKSPSGKASLFFKRLRLRAAYRVGLSGTPMPHGPMDIYAIFRFIEMSIFGPSYTAYRTRFGVMGGYQRRQITGYQNLDELERLMSRITFKVGDEVLDLPPATDVTYMCELTGEAARIYRDLEEDFVARVKDGTVTAANAMVKLLRLQQITGGCVPTDDDTIHRIDSSKQKLLADTLEDIGKDEPAVVFCRFTADLLAVHEACEGMGFSSLELSGKRDELKRWQDGEAQVLAVQIDAGSEGVDFTRARYSIFFSVGYSLGKYDQARKRTHRPGQTEPVTHIHLIARNTVDVKVMRALEKRAEIVQSILAEIKN